MGSVNRGGGGGWWLVGGVWWLGWWGWWVCWWVGGWGGGTLDIYATLLNSTTKLCHCTVALHSSTFIFTVPFTNTFTFSFPELTQS